MRRRPRSIPEHNIRWYTAGFAAALISGALVLSAGVCSLGISPIPECLTATMLLDVGAIVFSVFTVYYLAYIVFGTQGLAHPLLTLWRIVDIVLAHLIGQSILSFLLWKIGIVLGDSHIFSHTGVVRPAYAAYDLIIYTVLMLSGGGVVDNTPLHESVRLILTLQLAWNSITVIIVLAAAVATLAEHTDAFVNPTKQ